MPKSAKVGKLHVVEETEAPAGNAPDRECFHYYVGQIEAQNQLCANARMLRKKVRRSATDAGLNLARIDLLLKRRDNDGETAEEWLGDLVKEAVWMGMTPESQLDLFEEDKKHRTLEQVAEEQGYVEGLEARDPAGERYDASTPTGQARLRGWHKGQAVIQERWLNQQEQSRADG